MNIPSIIASAPVKFLSGLGNNDSSLTAMIIKDWIGDGATVYTYKKDGGKDDAREKAIEEFGTGAAWLFGIPAVKKLLEKTVYPIFKLNPDFDPRILDDKEKLSQIKDNLKNATGDFAKKQKELFSTLQDKNPVLKSFTNAQLYKGFAISKFAIATVATGIALSTIIKYKQKTTTDRINKELEQKNKQQTTSALLSKQVKDNITFEKFTAPKNNNLSFTGGLAEFMYNPIKNTMILDGVITTTRLKEARKGEKLEVGFKELCQIVFIYGLAKPLQLGFEAIGKKMKCPIELDPLVLFDKNIIKNIDASKDSISQIKNSKNVLKTLGEIDVKNPIMQILANDGVISLTKDKTSIDYLKQINEKDVLKTLDKLEDLKNNSKNLKNIKAFKTFAVVANVLLGAYIMGVIQPKLNIWMRKILNNGDNRNPAIVAQEEEMKKKQINT